MILIDGDKLCDIPDLPIVHCKTLGIGHGDECFCYRSGKCLVEIIGKPSAPRDVHIPDDLIVVCEDNDPDALLLDMKRPLFIYFHDFPPRLFSLRHSNENREKKQEVWIWLSLNSFIMFFSYDRIDTSSEAGHTA